MKDIKFNDNKPVVSVLLETDFTKEIRIAMRQGQEMKKHQTAFPIVIEIVEGEIEFGLEDKNLTLEKGGLISLKSSIPHNLKANKDSIVRLTLSTFDQAERVKNLIK